MKHRRGLVDLLLIATLARVPCSLLLLLLLLFFGPFVAEMVSS